MNQRTWSLPEHFVRESLVLTDWNEYQKTYEIAIQTENAIIELGEKRPSNIQCSKNNMLSIKHEGLIYECIVLPPSFFGIFKPLLSFSYEKNHLIVLFSFKPEDGYIAGNIYKDVDLNTNMSSNREWWINFDILK